MIDCWQTKGRSHMWAVCRWDIDVHVLRQTTIGKTILCLPGPTPVWHQHMSHPLCNCILWFIIRQFVFLIHRNTSPNGGSRMATMVQCDWCCQYALDCMYTYERLLFLGKAHSCSFSFKLLRKWFLELIICQVYWEYVSISCLACIGVARPHACKCVDSVSLRVWNWDINYTYSLVPRCSKKVEEERIW